MAVIEQDSVLYFERGKMSTSSSSPWSSPQDRNLISGRTRGSGDVWRNSVDGFHWNVGHVFSTYRVTPVPRRAGSDMTRGLGGLLEQVC